MLVYFTFVTLINNKLMKKKLIYLMFLAFGMTILPANAQTNNNAQKQTLVKKVSTFWKKTKKQVATADKNIGDAIGVDDLAKKNNEDLKEIDGVKYMPIYTTDLFANNNLSDDEELIKNSKEVFAAKYPDAKIVHCVVPQKEWIMTAIKEGSKITGYRKYVYCYLLAKDGTDGYINARFLFLEYRDAGENYVKSASWPKWDRTDIVPNSVYSKLAE